MHASVGYLDPGRSAWASGVAREGREQVAGSPCGCRGRPGRARPLPRGGRMAAVSGRLPLVEPMLATPVREVPGNDGDWAAEAKWDGTRVLAYVSGGAAVLRGRSGARLRAAGH